MRVGVVFGDCIVNMCVGVVFGDCIVNVRVGVVFGDRCVTQTHIRFGFQEPCSEALKYFRDVE